MPSASPFSLARSVTAGRLGGNGSRPGSWMPESSKGGRWLMSVPSKRTRRATACAGRHFRQRLDFLRCAAESGALEQVRGKIVIPIRGGDGRQIVLPGRGSGGLRDGGGKKRASRHSLRHVRTPSEPTYRNGDRNEAGMQRRELQTLQRTTEGQTGTPSGPGSACRPALTGVSLQVGVHEDGWVCVQISISGLPPQVRQRNNWGHESPFCD